MPLHTRMEAKSAESLNVVIGHLELWSNYLIYLSVYPYLTRKVGVPRLSLNTFLRLKSNTFLLNLFQKHGKAFKLQMLASSNQETRVNKCVIDVADDFSDHMV